MKALIITDGTDSILAIAKLIKEALAGNTKSKIKAKITDAADFKGNELLSSDFFFIGCEAPSPSSFSSIETFLKHVNLVSRKCGVFSAKTKTKSYLKGILKDSEADIAEPLIADADSVKKSDIKKWIKLVTK